MTAILSRHRRPNYKKTLNEDDYQPARQIHALFMLSGLVRLSKNRLHLIKSGKQAVVDKVLLFRVLLLSFVEKYIKANLDTFENQEIGNLAFMYVVYLLGLHGNKRREVAFYANLYFKAFPELINQLPQTPYWKPEDMAFTFLIHRTLEYGQRNFGTVHIEYEGESYVDRKTYVKISGSFNSIFKIQKGL